MTRDLWGQMEQGLCALYEDMDACRERLAAQGLDLNSAAEAARLFLASLECLSLVDERRACELRHCLRRPDLPLLREVVAFLGGIHPAREDQALLIRGLMGFIERTERLAFWQGAPHEARAITVDVSLLENPAATTGAAAQKTAAPPLGRKGVFRYNPREDPAPQGRSMTIEQIEELAEYR